MVTSDEVAIDMELSEWAIYLAHRDKIIPVLDPDLYPIEWLDAQVYVGNARVFAHSGAIILTEFKVYPTGFREIHGLVAAGDLETIRDVLIPQAEAFGKAHGCGLASIASRHGWAKVLPDYSVYQVTLRKVI